MKQNTYELQLLITGWELKIFVHYVDDARSLGWRWFVARSCPYRLEMEGIKFWKPFFNNSIEIFFLVLFAPSNTFVEGCKIMIFYE